VTHSRGLVALGVTLALSLAVARAYGADRVSNAPNHDRAIQLESGIDWTLKNMSGPLEQSDLINFTRVLATVRQAVAMLSFDEPALSAEELTQARALESRAGRWAKDEDRLIAAEEIARDTTVLPLCRALTAIEALKTEIAEQHASRTGAPDAAKIRRWQQQIRVHESHLEGLRRRYEELRHHAFVGPRSETACDVPDAHSGVEAP
jgi:hypothetical protein